MRLIAVAFALALASTAQATPPVQVAQPDQMVTQVRQGCGAGMVRRAGVCVPRGGVAAAAGYGSSTNLSPGYGSNPNYGYGPGPGPGYAYGPGPGPGYGYSPVLTPGYGSSPGRPGYAYGTGYMAHDLGGPMRNGDLCWSDKDSWGNTGQGYWKPCPK